MCECKPELRWIWYDGDLRWHASDYYGDREFHVTWAHRKACGVTIRPNGINESCPSNSPLGAISADELANAQAWVNGDGPLWVDVEPIEVFEF